MAQHFQIPYDLFMGILEFTDVEIGQIFRGVGKYLYIGEMPDFSGKPIYGSFLMIKPYVEADRGRYKHFCNSRSLNGKKGGRPKKDWDNSQKAKKATKARKPIDIDNIYIDNIYITNSIDIDKYNILCEKFGKEKVEEKIEDMVYWIYNTNNGKGFKDYYLALNKWLRKDKKRDEGKLTPERIGWLYLQKNNPKIMKEIEKYGLFQKYSESDLKDYETLYLNSVLNGS